MKEWLNMGGANVLPGNKPLLVPEGGNLNEKATDYNAFCLLKAINVHNQLYYCDHREKVLLSPVELHTAKMHLFMYLK